MKTAIRTSNPHFCAKSADSPRITAEIFESSRRANQSDCGCGADVENRRLLAALVAGYSRYAWRRVRSVYLTAAFSEILV